MAAKNRADLINKLFRIAKKEYDFIKPLSSRNVFEHMLYGCCLENSTLAGADETFAKLQENFCDWNEVRVTTVDELAETGKGLGSPRDNAQSVKQTLYGVFEKYFTYDLDFLKKENLSKSVATFETFKGVTPFVVAYFAQNGLGGHSIPIDRSMMSLFYVLGIVSEDEANKGRVPGLERTIAKSKGVEFFVVVHQLAVAFASSPFSKSVRDKLLKINPNAKERFPKRASKKKTPAKEKEPQTPKKQKTQAKSGKVAAKAVTKAKSKTAAPKKKVAKKVAPRKTTKKKASKKPVKKAPKKKAVKKTAKKKVAKKVTKKTTARKKTAKKSPTKKLSKKKPR